MSSKRRKFTRRSNILEYRPVFIIATEGKRTEPDYLRMRVFKPPQISVKIELLPSKDSSSPNSVLHRMKEYIKDYKLREKDEIWLVIDTDQWKKRQIEQLYNWCEIHSYTNLAVSNPQFEYWLLLHFEDGHGVHNKSECLRKLKCHCPNYSKSNLETHKYTLSNVKDAIKRAKLKDNPPCEKWPENTGTTVYRMIERIITLTPTLAPLPPFIL